MLTEFSETQKIPYPLLSDIDSKVIGDYGILNTEVERHDAVFYGIPFPGVYVCDENGVVVAKFFHDSYKKRDSPELLIDAALGRTQIAEDAPQTTTGDEDVRVTAVLHGGKGSIRQGIRRHVVVRFELGDGLHIYGEPAPEGMTPAKVSVTGPPGLVVEDPILPPTETLRLASLNIELEVWSGTVDIAIPIYPVGELASETRPFDRDTAKIEVGIRYQACSDDVCLLPKTEALTLEVPLDVIDVPALGIHMGHGQREAGFSGNRHMLRLFLRKVAPHPLQFAKFMLKSLRLERAAAARRRQG